MKSKRWVQHISGEGKKFELDDDQPYRNFYTVHHDAMRCHNDWAYLPLTEYRICDPPDRWEDVTEGCEFESIFPTDTADHFSIWHATQGSRYDVMKRLFATYRLRKVQAKDALGPNDWAFIVERKVSE